MHAQWQSIKHSWRSKKFNFNDNIFQLTFAIQQIHNAQIGESFFAPADPEWYIDARKI